VRILTVVHQSDAGPGVFAEVARERGDELVEWIPAEAVDPPPQAADPGAVLVLGGGMHPDQEDEHPWLRGEKRLLRSWLDEDRPMLGVCLGAELVGEVAGASAERLPEAEIGWRPVALTAEAAEDPIFAGLPQRFEAFQWHSFTTPLPQGATRLAGGEERTDAFSIGQACAIQFHAEVTAEIARGWIEKYREDPDAVAAGLEPEPLRSETSERIDDWNAIGRSLFRAFLDRARGV
jgi:GMP synthase-like glutamine amidotransferase